MQLSTRSEGACLPFQGGHSPTPLIVPFGKQQFFIDDETIAKQLKEKPLNGTGKR